MIVLLAQPVREAVQNALDRMFYRDRYDYRRALVAFARDLNSDLDSSALASGWSHASSRRWSSSAWR